MAKGYWQIPVDEGFKDKTTFTTSFKLYVFNVMLFGTFQRMINHVLRDIVVSSGSWEDHLDHLHKVLNCLHKVNLTIKMAKRQFGRNEVHYLDRRRKEVN